MTQPDLEALRARLGALDEQLLELVGQRQALSLEIGRSKAKLGRSTRDFAREKVVLDKARAGAERLGLDPKLAERLMVGLIESSLSVQELDRIERQGGGSGRRALVLGGSGKMGRWFVGFLAAQGWSVELADPTPGPDDLPQRTNWQDGDLDHDLIIVAVPLHATNGVLQALAQRRPAGVVFDVGSLKTPLRTGLQALCDAGVKVTSIHPMFGPDTALLSGRHVLFVDVGCTEATATARTLFEPTMADLVDVDLDTHDRLVAYVLGLSHALNLAFNSALGHSGTDLALLGRISSTTFDAQLGVSRRVAQENPQLYYEIQALNHYGAASLRALQDAVNTLLAQVESRDEAGFIEQMLAGRANVMSVRP